MKCYSIFFNDNEIYFTSMKGETTSFKKCKSNLNEIILEISNKIISNNKDLFIRKKIIVLLSENSSENDSQNIISCINKYFKTKDVIFVDSSLAITSNPLLNEYNSLEKIGDKIILSYIRNRIKQSSEIFDINNLNEINDLSKKINGIKTFSAINIEYGEQKDLHIENLDISTIIQNSFYLLKELQLKIKIDKSNVNYAKKLIKDMNKKIILSISLIVFFITLFHYKNNTSDFIAKNLIQFIFIILLLISTLIFYIKERIGLIKIKNINLNSIKNSKKE